MQNCFVFFRTTIAKTNTIKLLHTMIAWFIHNGPENLKKSRPKKLVKSNKNQFQEKNFWTEIHFLLFQKCNFTKKN